MVALEKAITEVKLKKVELLQDFTERHPYVIAINDQQNRLKHELSALEAEVKTLPRTEQKMLSLERDVRVKSELYSLILSKIQQLQIVKEGTISDVRILNLATKATKLPSKAPLIITGGLLFGFILALGIILLRRVFMQRMDDPDYIEERLGVPLYAVIPHSKKQSQIFREIKRGLHKGASTVLATIHTKDLAIEGLRSLRTILLLSLQKSENNVVAILGASPNIGKSFVSTNLAYVLADGGKKVLLIDADLRRGKIHSYVAQNVSPGLTEILAEKTTFEHAKRNLNGKVFMNGGGVDFLPCGQYPDNPAELLFGDSIERIVEKVASKYDVVIIDTPPILAAADAIIIAKCASVNLLLVGSKSESIRELEHTIKRLQKHHIDVQGLIFNSTTLATGYGGYGYGYSYQAKK
jgi:tyrosine-protein kinase Etk/Wzc